jgi:hypothetical protein
MELRRKEVLKLIYPQLDDEGSDEVVRGRRFTQDTPIMPDVWVEFARRRTDRVDLLLTPNSECSISDLVRFLRVRLARERGPGAPAVALTFNESHIAAKLTLEELIRAALPLSDWFYRMVLKPKTPLHLLSQLGERPDLDRLLMDPASLAEGNAFPEDLLNMARIAGAIVLGRMRAEQESWRDYLKLAVLALDELLRREPPLVEMLPAEAPYPLWSVFLNRRASSAIARSRLAIKADAAVRLFDIRCEDIRWAVIDSGIDARHPAFWARAEGKICVPKPEDFPRTRIVKTYDFSRLRPLLESAFLNSEEFNPEAARSAGLTLDEATLAEIHRDVFPRLNSGRFVDWKPLAQLIEIPHDHSYPRPENEHGTHVAGILAADWRPEDGTGAPDEGLIGICPDLELYDLRVFNARGSGDEFSILAALQFVRWLNASKDKMQVQGVNLSFSLRHMVDSFACGATPVCEECARLVASGVVVVAAAGNRGYDDPGDGGFGAYRPSSLADPGNAEDVITVGATHRYMPHKYGVSYFSSRGPTGDGRMKPDLVAPGEKIVSTTPKARWVKLDGTSMAAPHVSGAAALLLARHRELIGSPLRVKKILCSTATDLGRTREFQGAGMLDVLRALQSV